VFDWFRQKTETRSQREIQDEYVRAALEGRLRRATALRAHLSRPESDGMITVNSCGSRGSAAVSGVVEVGVDERDGMV